MTVESGEVGVAPENEFFEALPPSCPPADAIDCAIGPVYRLVASEQPTDHCFTSKAALGTPKPIGKHVDDCRWASCSLFSKIEVIHDLLKLPRIKRKYSHIAVLSIPNGAGKHIADDAHVDFWRYGQFDIRAAIQKVEAA